MRTLRSVGAVILVIAVLELIQAAVAEFFGFTEIQATFVVGAIAAAFVLGIVAAKAGEETD